MQTSAISSQNVDIVDDGTISANTCNFTQQSVITLLATQITKNIMNFLQQNHITQTGYDSASMTTSQTNVGLSFGFIGMVILIIVIIGGLLFFKGEQAAAKYIIPIGLVSLVLLIVGIVYFSIKKDTMLDIGAGVGFLIVSILLAYTFIKRRNAMKSMRKIAPI